MLFPLVVRVSPGKALLAALCSALSGVLAHLLLVAAGRPMPATLTFATLYLPNLAAVALAAVTARVVYRMTTAVNEARHMGDYRLVERLGKGGMGEVWRAEHLRLPRSAAVKFIRPEVLFERDASQASGRGSGQSSAPQHRRDALARTSTCVHA